MNIAKTVKGIAIGTSLAAFTSLAVQNAEVDLVLKTRNHEHVVRIVDALKRAGFNARAHPVE